MEKSPSPPPDPLSISLNMDGFRVESKMRAKVIVPFEEDRGRTTAMLKGGREARGGGPGAARQPSAVQL